MIVETTEDKLFDLIEEHLGTRPESASQRFVEDLGADSLDFIEIVMVAEDEFDISIEDDEYGEEKTPTVEALITLIDSKRAAK